MQTDSLRSPLLFALVCALGACGGGEASSTQADSGAGVDSMGVPDTGAVEDLGVTDDGLDASPPDADAPGDAAIEVTEVADAPLDTAESSVPPGATYRNSLSVCWTDATCTRALAVAHGGDWVVTGPPYDSDAALMAAYVNGADGVKIDVRVTKDNVPVISHSSPLTAYESLDCLGKKIETSTAAEITACHRFPSTTEKFQRLGDVLDTLKGKLVIQLCVKVSTDYARTIAEVIAHGATDFAFIEIPSGDFFALAPTMPSGDKVYYLVNVASTVADVDTLLALKNPRAVMYEFDPTVSVTTLVTTKLHPAGVRSFTYDSSSTATVADLKAHYDNGYDVVSSNMVANEITARIAVNKSRSITPP